MGGGNSPTSRGSSLVRPGNTDSKYSRQQNLLREDKARMKKQDAAGGAGVFRAPSRMGRVGGVLLHAQTAAMRGAGGLPTAPPACGVFDAPGAGVWERLWEDDPIPSRNLIKPCEPGFFERLPLFSVGASGGLIQIKRVPKAAYLQRRPRELR